MEARLAAAAGAVAQSVAARARPQQRRPRRERRDRRPPAGCSRELHRADEITIDLGALRRNVRQLLGARRRRLWAVVKADGYGHGAVDVAGAALGAGATALCVATVDEGLELRA